MADVNIINHQQFFNSLKDFHCGKVGFVELNTTDFWLPFKEVKPPEGYQAPENAITGEKFPNCCETHKKLLKDAEDWFDLFPQCCEAHKNLLKTTWFNKESYKGVAMKIIQQLVYTTTHIGNQLEKPDWYKEIADYIEYNVESFGQLPTGYGNPVGLHIYLPQLKNWIESKDIALPEDKRKRLSQCIDGYYHYTAPPTGKDNRDLNILHATYLRWLKLFPFEISYFSQLKKQYSSQLPILAEPPVLNKYTGLAKAKLQSQEELIKSLHNLTIQLLQQVNVGQLLEKGVISDKNKHAIELTTANHKLKQDTLISKFTKGELKYVKVLKAWLANEKQYFKELLPMIQTSIPNPLGKVLTRDEYFQIIMEIYNLHNNTIDIYLTDKYKEYLPKNPEFVECLLKDIHKVSEGVNKPGDNDILIENGDFAIEHGDIKRTGNGVSNLELAEAWLWIEYIKKYTDANLNIEDFLAHFENEFLTRNDYTPAYAKKIADLNKELKNANTPPKQNGGKQKGPNPDIKLSDICITKKAYKTIIDWLVDKSYCHSETFKWKDSGKGSKGVLIAILKDLWAKGYYKKGVVPSHEDYRNIAKNTFDWEVAIDTIKKAKPQYFLIDFLPVYSDK